MLDSRSRVCGLKPHRGHCIVSLGKTLQLYPLFSTGLINQHSKTRPDITHGI